MQWDSLRHEVRVGWGDPIFESAMKYEFPHLGKPNTDVTYLTGHFFAEYQYYWLPWLFDHQWRHRVGPCTEYENGVLPRCGYNCIGCTGGAERFLWCS